MSKILRPKHPNFYLIGGIALIALGVVVIGISLQSAYSLLGQGCTGSTTCALPTWQGIGIYMGEVLIGLGVVSSVTWGVFVVISGKKFKHNDN